MATMVYSLCAIASALCAWLLIRAHLRTRSPLLLWSSISFAGLALNNIVLWIDKLVVPDIDLSIVRTPIALISTLVLLWGLIWEEW